MASYGLLSVLLLLLEVIANQKNGVQAVTEVYRIGPCPFVRHASCPDIDNIKFHLFTRQNIENGQLLDIEADLSQTLFDFSVPTKILVHGYFVGYNSPNFVKIRQAYLTVGKFNVIAMDYGNLSPGPEMCYPFAVYNAPHAGQCLAQLVQWLRVAGVKDIHMVGFSLGAHVSGYAANHLRPYLLPRITGLDPAKPFFITILNDNKLDASDAEFVDVIHTNAAFQGVVEQSGHVDFYVNGGSYQLGCGSFVDGFWSGCHHNRAALYFAESINSTIGFWGWECSSHLFAALGLCQPSSPAILMGENVSHSARGFVTVPTNNVEPFAMGPWFVQQIVPARMSSPYYQVSGEASLPLPATLGFSALGALPAPVPSSLPAPWYRIRSYISQIRRHNLDTDLLI